MLKGVVGKETEYLVSKGLLNSIYGMMVTDIVRDEITYNNDEWGLEAADGKDQITKYNNSRKRFNYYPWGIYCTALARKNLIIGMLNIGNNDPVKNHYCYSDTDSLKIIHIEEHKTFIDQYNHICELKLKKMCEYYNLDYESELLPKTIKGEVKPLGVYDHDGHYDFFKCLRAKCYMYSSGDKLSITVSGVNKHVAVPYIVKTYGVNGAFEAFKDGFEVPEDYTGKLTHYYIDKPYNGQITDYLGHTISYYSPSGIYLEKTSYVIDIMDKYIEFLKGVFYTK